jgi:Flp pilus assembly CpaE family ATPase
MVDHPAGVSVLAEQANQFDVVSWSPAALHHLLVLLRSRFDFVVLDTGHGLDAVRLEAVRLADDILLVQRLDSPTVEITTELVARLGSERIISVINRYGQEQQLDWRQVQDEMQLEIVEWIPDDPARVNHATNARRPLMQVATEAPITQSFARLAERWLQKCKMAQPISCWLEVG